MKYVLKKRNKSFKVIKSDYPFKGFKFKPNNDLIKAINILDDKLINIILSSKINTMFTRLLMIVNDAFNSDDNPDGASIALDEITMVRNAITNKYEKFLKKEKQELYLKKLDLVEEEMRFKYYTMQNNYKEEKGKGR